MSIDFDMVNCGSGTGYDYYTAQSMCTEGVSVSAALGAVKYFQFALFSTGWSISMDIKADRGGSEKKFRMAILICMLATFPRQELLHNFKSHSKSSAFAADARERDVDEFCGCPRQRP
ncbi:hypothetical protein EVAR_100424_1 [Eumeta japonica]|uniref:Uncharacterized protein n=1 Tax=Eumeta variegata TaxID=151549 RepID=A0A4C2A4T5_EUMVA|nr:hypothetical protein EVAR_100424_1 [Eumeta japonica]